MGQVNVFASWTHELRIQLEDAVCLSNQTCGENIALQATLLVCSQTREEGTKMMHYASRVWTKYPRCHKLLRRYGSQLIEIQHGYYSCQKHHQLLHWLCSDFNLRLLTNELGGRLDYGQPGHRSRLRAKTFGGVMALCSTDARAFTHGNAVPWNPGNTLQLQRC
jgi:hypothetical protein